MVEHSIRTLTLLFMYFVIFQALLKYNFMTDLKYVIKIIDFLSNIFKNNSKRISRDYDLCCRYARLSKAIIIAVPITYITVGTLYQVPKFVVYFRTGVMEPSFGVYFPRVNYASNEVNDVVMHMFNMSIFLIVPSIIITFDSVIYLVFVNLTMIPTILKRDLQELKAVLEKPKQKQIKSKLAQIVQMHRDYNE